MTCLLISKKLSAPGRLIVEGDELHYLVNVRRHRQGDRVEVRGGDGARYVGKIERIDRKTAVLILEREMDRAPESWPVNLIVAVPKRNLLDDVIRKTSEIGAERIVPVRAERSTFRLEPSRIDRWRRIASESIRQCGREKPIGIDEIEPLTDALARFGSRGSRFIMHPYSEAPCLSSMLASNGPAVPVTVAIGPEGGFSDEDVEAAGRLGFRSATFGAQIMRIDTATIAAAVLCVARLSSKDSKSLSFDNTFL